MPPPTLNSEEPVISNEVGRDADALCPFDQLLEHMHDDAFPWVTLLYLEYKRVVLSSNASRVGHPICSGPCCWECAVSVACSECSPCDTTERVTQLLRAVCALTVCLGGQQGSRVG